MDFSRYEMEWTFWPQSPKKPERPKKADPVQVAARNGCVFVRCDVLENGKEVGQATRLVVYGYPKFKAKEVAAWLALAMPQLALDPQIFNKE